MSKISVAVLMGGKSSEREVSLSTGRMIMGALDKGKYDAFSVDAARFGADSEFIQTGDLYPMEVIVSPDGSCPRPDVVFIALHGRFGEDGTIQGLLELLGIPYVGSGVLASALAMDKIMTRKVLQHEGIPVPRGIELYDPLEIVSLKEQVARELGYPVVVKPNREGSSIGLTIVRSEDELAGAVELALRYGEVLIEEFIEGTEITVPVLGNHELQALPVVEIVPTSGHYDYYSKYTPGATDEIVPARIPDEVYRRAQELGIACHKALGCRGMSRTDMRIRGDVYVLEVNTIPGMTPTSLLPRAAEAAGIAFPKLLDLLIGYALEGR